MRIALGVEYNGHAYCGWQAQRHEIKTVQQTLEQALAKVANEPVRVICAGRTDTGVHGAEQVVHFDTEVQRDSRGWVYGANSNMPSDVRVLWATEVSDDFHARFSARRRRYQYVIFNRPIAPAYLANLTTWDYRPLDENKMQLAANYLIGKHDFDAYRAVGCQSKSPIREVYKLTVTRQNQFVYLNIEANAFLHHMVRNIAGVLMEIGAGLQQPEWANKVLQTRDRTQGGLTASASGLYLTGVTYDDAFSLPQLEQYPSIFQLGG